MGRISLSRLVVKRISLAKTILRSPVAWIGAIVGAVFVLAACSGGVGAPSNDDNVPAGPVVGDRDQAPNFELVLFGTENHSRGEKLSLADLRGKPVVVNFWFPSCPPCRAEMPDLEASFKKHSPGGVQFVGVQLLGLDTGEDGQSFVDETGVTYALGADEEGSIIRDYSVTSFPTTVFLDEDHRIVRKWGGILTADKLEELVQQILFSTETEMT